MRAAQRIISIGFAAAAIAAGSMPALSGTAWPDADFEWYANVGRAAAAPATPSTESSEPMLPASGSNRR